MVGAWDQACIFGLTRFFSCLSAIVVLPLNPQPCFARAQIKYLRIPDELLDQVKDEQIRAREAGRAARGAHPGQRGTSCIYFMANPILTRFLSRTWRTSGARR